jgi:hypothetical protein
MLVPEKTLPLARIKVAFINSLTRPSVPVHLAISMFKVFQDIVSKIRGYFKRGNSLFPKRFPCTFGHIAGKSQERLSRRAGIVRRKTGKTVWERPPSTASGPQNIDGRSEKLCSPD